MTNLSEPPSGLSEGEREAWKLAKGFIAATNGEPPYEGLSALEAIRAYKDARGDYDDATDPEWTLGVLEELAKLREENEGLWGVLEAAREVLRASGAEQLFANVELQETIAIFLSKREVYGKPSRGGENSVRPDEREEQD